MINSRSCGELTICRQLHIVYGWFFPWIARYSRTDTPIIVSHWNLNNEFLFSPFTSPFYRGFSLGYPRDFPIFPWIFSGSPCLIIFGDMICTYIYISYRSMITSHFPIVFSEKTRDPARRNCRTPSKRLKPPCKQRPSVVSAPWANFRVQSAGNDVTMGNPSCTKLTIIIWIIYIWPYSTIFKYMTVFKYIWPY